MNRRRAVVLGIGALLLQGTGMAPAQEDLIGGGANLPELALPAMPGAASNEILLSPEGNRLNVIDTGSLARRTLIPSVSQALADPGVDDARGRDINGQICVHTVLEQGQPSIRFVSGEDSKDDAGERPGWGYFRLTGGNLASLDWQQLGKLDPDAYAGDPDNFGCGFLSSGNLVTTAIGDILFGDPATGELILWFADSTGGFTQGFTTGTNANGGTFTDGSVPYCKLDQTLATAGGIWVDGEDNIYVAANRPDDDGNPGGIFKYSGPLPTSPDAQGGCGRTTADGEPLVDAGRLTKTLLVPQFLPVSPFALTPSSVMGSGRTVDGEETFYVSSVFTGTVSEFLADGTFFRSVLLPPGPLPVGQVTGITPFGLAVSADGTLYVADLGIVTVAPVPGAGSVVRIPFLEVGAPVPPWPLLPEQVDDALTFPDGIGLVQLD